MPEVHPSIEARAHSAVWVRRPREVRGRIVRVSWDGDTAVSFGDGPLADLADREHVFVDVGTGEGALRDEFAARLRELDAARVADELILELAGHVSLGRTLEEVQSSLAGLRKRRLVALEP